MYVCMYNIGSPCTMSLANHSPFDSFFILIYIRMLHVLHMSCHGNVLCNFTIVLPIHNVVGQSRSILKYICCVLHMFTGCCCALEDCCENKEDSIWGPKH